MEKPIKLSMCREVLVAPQDVMQHGGKKTSSTASSVVNTVSYSKDWTGKIRLWLILTFVMASLWNIDKIVLCQY